jgi:hypothetical protein
VNSWGNPLIAIGDTLKQEKCFYLIISFECVYGEWQYKDNSINGSFAVTVPFSEGSSAATVHHPITHAEKTLGAMTSPDGISSGAVQQMQEKAQQWVDAVRNNHLHHPNVWFSLEVQFWLWVGYSLCNSTASYEDLENTLQMHYYQILPLGGESEWHHSTAGWWMPVFIVQDYQNKSKLQLLCQTTCECTLDAGQV